MSDKPDDARIRDKTRFPSRAAQERYPLADFPCDRCENKGLPFLVDNGAELNWEHQPEGEGRSGCHRFSRYERLGANPREGTAVSKWVRDGVLVDPENPWPPTGDGSLE